MLRILLAVLSLTANRDYELEADYIYLENAFNTLKKFLREKKQVAQTFGLVSDDLLFHGQ